MGPHAILGLIHYHEVVPYPFWLGVPVYTTSNIGEVFAIPLYPLISPFKISFFSI